MIKTKNNEFRQILLDSKNYHALHLRYGANRSFNEVITEILALYENAISIIDDCENCKPKFKEAFDAATATRSK